MYYSFQFRRHGLWLTNTPNHLANVSCYRLSKATRIGCFTIVVGHAVALRAANSVFFMLPLLRSMLSCGVNRPTMCGRAIPLLFPLVWNAKNRNAGIEHMVAIQIQLMRDKAPRKLRAEVVFHFSALYGLIFK